MHLKYHVEWFEWSQNSVLAFGNLLDERRSQFTSWELSMPDGNEKKKSYPFHSKIQTHKRSSDSYFDIQMSILFDGIVVQNAIFMCVWFVWTWLWTLYSLNSTLVRPLCILFHSNLLFFLLLKSPSTTKTNEKQHDE